MQPFKLLYPSTVDEALELMHKDEDAMFWGGGAASTILLKQGLMAPETVIALERISEVQGISRSEDGSVRIGSMVRLRELELSPFLASAIPSLSETAGVIANVRVRNVATLGGHLVHADPAQDLPPLLLALDAVVRIRSPKGERKVPISDFFIDMMETAVDDNEILVDIVIPEQAIKRMTRYVKFRPRSQDDYCTVGVAGSLTLTEDRKTIRDVRIAVGGAGPKAYRFSEVENILTGNVLTQVLLDEVGRIVHDGVEPWDDARGSEQYKREMAAVWTKRVLSSLVHGLQREETIA